MNPDIRWKQRFANYQKALSELREAIQISRTRELSKLEKQGLIQGFEYTHELAWTLMKDYIEYQGPAEVKGSRDATREAFKRGLITDGTQWMDMIRGRNLTSHTYNQSSANQLAQTIIDHFYPLFEELNRTFESLLKKGG